MTRAPAFTGLVLCACVAAAGPARADAVVDWNDIATQAIFSTPTHGGAPSTLDVATVHVAIYDAVVAYEGRVEPYHARVSNAHGSPAAAVAKAARDVLVNRLPDAQDATVDAAYHAYLLSHNILEDDPGVAVGAEVAADIIALRADDGSFFPPATYPPFTGGTDPGEWRPTPPALAPMLAPWLGSVTPFTLKSSSQLRPEPPPPLNSGRYAREYDEAKALGRFDSTVRTPAQTDLAYFWSGNFGAQYNRLMRNLATTRQMSMADSARMFALANAAIADAIIGCWDAKLHYNFWRPITAIREGDNDGNNRTAGDPTWTPLITTPPYPDYTSGANNITGAFTRAMQLFFGTDRMEFDITTEVPLATTKSRHYSRFSIVADEVVEARILLGIHFRTADVVARRTGEKAAQWAYTHAFRPAGGGEEDDEED
jgi:hypothetical protein